MESPMSTAKLKKDALKVLVAEPMALKELAAAMGLKEKKVFNLLKGLFESGDIVPMKAAEGKRKYRSTTPEEKAAHAASVEAAAKPAGADDDDVDDDKDDD